MPIDPDPVEDVLPADPEATVVGRLFDPAVGPCVVTVRDREFVDLTAVSPTTAALLDRADLLDVLRTAPGGRRWPVAEVARASRDRDTTVAHLLSPIDLQVVKAAGVTFVRSLLERVIEERAQGDPTGAAAIRQRLVDALGGALSDLEPGSAEAMKVKDMLMAEGFWSQYLEVGIGPDPEVFTKAPVLSTVGYGAAVGVLERSIWNNPEPEVVLVVNSVGALVGATLGNDVNLRDFEGRSALLLGTAKDNNASCSIGPLIRVCDGRFGLGSIVELDVEMRIEGAEGFALSETSSMREMSRSLPQLIKHVHGRHHAYPDGFVLFTGTMFAPTRDRNAVGQGFTHARGDVVTIANPSLGRLVNVVTTSEDAARWRWGIGRLMGNLAARGLL
ncbi:MAG: fumarylacetoacetate hydrolase family protein [Pseudonocardia sp.]|nr:fumarylacetoacetate hydrolase family protein [Pseudonocardia sp.]